jgi:hypothetical protein
MIFAKDISLYLTTVSRNVGNRAMSVISKLSDITLVAYFNARHRIYRCFTAHQLKRAI